MPRQSLILVVAALGLVALVAGAAWWIAEPEDARFAAIEPEIAEAEEFGDEEPFADVDLTEAVADEREPVPIAALMDGAPEAARADDVSAHRANVSSQLVDAATGEPLPDYAFELIDARRQRVSVLTDAEGRFEATLHAGPLRARFSELPTREWIDAGELRFGPEGEPEPIALRVASGPTYRLAITPRDVVAPEMLRTRLHARVGGEDMRANGRVRGGPDPWTRLAPIAVAAAPLATLTIESIHGEWRGSAQVVLGPGVRSGVVPIVLEASCALEVFVYDPEGKPVPGARVEVESAQRQNSRRTQTGKEGRAQFGFLVQGEWTLVVRLARFEEWRRPMLLRPGELTRQDVLLARASSAGAIRGIVLSDTGRYRENVSVNLAQLDRENSPGTIGARVEWVETAGITTGRFEILDVPPGRWRLSVSENDWFEWEPRRTDLEPPHESLALRVHDAVPVVDLVFRPHTEGGAAFPSRYELRIASSNSTDAESRNGGAALISSFPVEQSLRWRVDAPGHAPAIGDWSAFVTEPHADGRDRRAAKPVLMLGWGELYRVTRSDNRRPVEGATVVVDGRAMGKTDKDGRVYVRAAAKPSSVTFRYRDWKLERRIDLNPPRSGSRELERSVRLQVPKPRAKK